MVKGRTHKLGLTRTTKFEEGDTTKIECYRFEMDVVVEKSGSHYYAEIAELGAACIGGGKSADDAVLDFARGFIALVEYQDDKDTLTAFFEKNFPAVQPSTNRAKFENRDDSLIAPWMVHGKDGLAYALDT